MSISKKDLVTLCKTMGIKPLKSNTKDQLKGFIKNYEDKTQVKVISKENKVVKYVYHSADIHIRTLDRHAEYQAVFDTLYNAILNKPELSNSVFVICGDIFHNRDRLVSETIILFNNFIEKMTSIIDVVMIAGNHDVFTHNDRLDTISGIVDIKKYTNFHFLKYSGVYCYNNINFVVSSLMDNLFLSPHDNGNVNILLYHGAVAGSKMDNNFKTPTTNESLKLKDFKGFDYVMLGDIHLRQFLSENVAYPGSLIQQNFKEERDHGIISWDIINKTNEFIKIKNEYGYVVLKIKDNQFDASTVFPEKSRIKLIHDYKEDIDFDKIKSEIKKHTQILSVSKEISSQSFQNDTDTSKEQDSDSTIFNKLIKKFNTKTQDKLKELHREEYYSVPVVKETSTWEIKSIEFKNIYIYGDDHINKFNFDSPGVIGILADNASGKSAFMNIIFYSLFGSITKTKSFLNRNIINKNKNEYYIKLVVTMNGKDYLIHRSGKNKTRKGCKSMEETLQFFHENTELTETNKLSTQEKIKQTFGIVDKELFMLTNVMNYSNYMSLLNMSSNDIGNVFSKLFNLEHYKTIYSNILKKLKTVNDKQKIIQDRLSNMVTSTETPEDCPDIEDQIKTKKDKLLKHDQSIIDLVKEDAKCIITHCDKPTQNEDELRSEIERITPQITKNKLETEENLEELILQKSRLDPGNVSLDITTYETSGDNVIIPKTKFQQILNLFGTQKEYSKITSKISFLLSNKVQVLNKKLIDIKKYSKNEELKKQKNILKNKIKIMNSEKEILKNELNQLISKKSNIDLLAKQQQDTETKSKLLQKELKENEEIISVYKNYKSIITDKALPKLILKNTISKVEKEANKMIYSLAGLIVVIHNDDEESKWEILIKKNNMILGSEQVSGFERFIINVGIKLALDKYKYYSGGSIFFIDEAFDCVSEENLEKIDTLFEYLNLYYRNTIIISHNEELKKKIQHRIHIKTDFCTSKIV